MSESSRSRVTITLGRSGQVVKRAGAALHNSFDDSGSIVGSKRSVRDRLGSNVESSGHYISKRQRREDDAVNIGDDIHLSKGDLRFKILQKSKLKRSHSAKQHGMDLRNILSRPAQSLTSSLGTRSRVPEPKEMRIHRTDPRDSRQLITSTRDVRQPMTMSRDSGQSIRDYREPFISDPRQKHMPDPRQKRMPEVKEARQGIPKIKDITHSMPESSRSSIIGPLPGSRTNSVTKADSVINSYSPWTVDHLRRISPDAILAGSRRLSPSRDEGLLRRLPVRPYDDTRSSTYITKGAFQFPRPSSSPFLMNTVPPSAPVKAMAPPVVAPSISGSFVQKSSHVVDDQMTVDSFLQSLGLEKYAIHFKAEEVDMYVLRQMGDSDLKDLGIPLGPRKKILLALLPLSKRPAR